MNPFQKLQETLRSSKQPTIKKGYKSAKQIAKECGLNYSSVRHDLQTAREQGLIESETYLINGHKTIYYRL